MDAQSNRGGARKNAGRNAPEGRTLIVKKHTVSYDDSTRRMLNALGGGNASFGIRVAVRFAYDAYQAGKMNLPKVG